VAPGAPVVALRDLSTLRVRAYVPQGRLSFTLGARAWATLDARPQRRFAARITYIAPAAEFTPSNVQTPEERSQQVFRIHATLEEGLEFLRPGVSVDLWFEP
jgi:multidrug efflux pump subunit AcrA (membrane-fusion protein)